MLWKHTSGTKLDYWPFPGAIQLTDFWYGFLSLIDRILNANLGESLGYKEMVKTKSSPLD